MEFKREDCGECFLFQRVCEYHRGFQEGWDASAQFTKSALEEQTVSDRLAAFTRRAAETGSDIPAHLLERSRRRRARLGELISHSEKRRSNR